MCNQPKDAYHLNEIAKWELMSDNSDVILPSLQRGLVWKPRQLELLWDSILRSFPIGSFVIELTADKKYLLDGQQRSNAIGLGFDTSIFETGIIKGNVVLWIDINPQEKISTRKFWIKATTTPHPWGYKNNDECTTLSANERRNALKCFFGQGDNKSIFHDKIDLNQTWPSEATLPIPLSIIVTSYKPNGDIDSYTKNVIDSLEELYTKNPRYKEKFCSGFSNLIKPEILHNLYDSIKRLKTYKVGINYLRAEDIAREAQEEDPDDGQKTNIDVLFERLGTGGTTISQADLSYSAIKSHWGEIKNENDNVAQKYMPASSLAMLAFRLIATRESDNESFAGIRSLAAIRKMAKNLEDKEKIVSLYRLEPGKESEISRIMQSVEQWIIGPPSTDHDNTPTIIRTMMARQYPDIYLLLMYFAKRIKINHEPTEKSIEQKFGPLSLFLLWHGIERHTAKIVNNIYRFTKGQNNINNQNICAAIYESIHDGHFKKIITPEEIKSWFNVKSAEIINDKHECYSELFNWGQESYSMLYYAQRKYLNDRFRNYDPAISCLWEEHNRPWDMDHIIPREWIDRKQNPNRWRCKFWLWKIGNCAAIPFELNRSKSNASEWNEYTNNKEALLYDDETSTINRNFIGNDIHIKLFAKLTFERGLKIYDICYNTTVKSLGINDFKFAENGTLDKRKKMFEGLAEKIDNASVYYVDGELQKKVETILDWASAWISVGVLIDEKMFVCITTNNMENFEIGIRRHPSLTAIDTQHRLEELNRVKSNFGLQEDNNWWYLWEEIENNNKTSGYEELLCRFYNIYNSFSRHELETV